MNVARCFLAFAFICQSSLIAQTVVVDDNLTFEEIVDPGASHLGTIYQDAGGSDPTSVGFLYSFSLSSASTLEALFWNIDEESDWYLVEEGDVFSAANIASGQFQPVFTVDNARPPVDVIAPDEFGFYLGVATTGTSADLPFTVDRDVFGWIELSRGPNSGDQLSSLRSAVAYGAQGIVVGSTTAVVPEPASLQLISSLVLGLACHRRRRTA